MFALLVLVVDLLFCFVLVLVPLDGVFIVLDGSVSDRLAGRCAGVQPVHLPQKPVMTATLLVVCHVTLYPVA